MLYCILHSRRILKKDVACNYLGLRVCKPTISINIPSASGLICFECLREKRDLKLIITVEACFCVGLKGNRINYERTFFIKNQDSFCLRINFARDLS